MKKMKENLSAKLKKKNGFTLVEMLVVIAIIAILVLVSIPMVTSSLDKAKDATDEANIRAAKATAAIEYLGNDKVAGTYIYDAENGKLVSESEGNSLESYGQGTKGKGKKIKVTITDATATAEGSIKCEWK